MTWAATFGAVGLLLPFAAQAAQSCTGPAAPPPLPPDLVAEAARPHAYPDFCDIPPIPQDVRPGQAWKAAVVETRLAGARLQQESGPDTWTLNGTDEFSDAARREAEPPPPMTSPDDTTEAFIKGARDRATPPPRPR